jgi:kynurenine formamidase
VAAPTATSPLPLTVEAFRERFEALKNWGRWGTADERGTLNHIDASRIAAALKTVTGDTTIGLGHALSARPGATNHYPIAHGTMPDGGYRLADGSHVGHHLEYIGMRPHGQAITHLDALCHFSVDGLTYNGRRVADTPMPEHGTVAAMRAGVVGRGVLLDVPRALGVDWLEPGQAVTPELARFTEGSQRTQVGPGDILLVRTGRRAREAKLGPWKTMEQLAGCDTGLLPWMNERGVAMLGGDGVSDTYPSPLAGLRTPVHVLALVAMGLPLIDNCALEELASACAARSRWEFLFVMGALDYPGGSSSPVNPIAIF